MLTKMITTKIHKALHPNPKIGHLDSLTSSNSCYQLRTYEFQLAYFSWRIAIPEANIRKSTKET
jgi:hypothetical protein